MNEIGWVKIPRLGRTGIDSPAIVIDSAPIGVALTGVAGAIITSTFLNNSATRCAYQRLKRCACKYQVAGTSAPARKRSRDNGSKSAARFCKLEKCRFAPSDAVMM